MYQNFDSYAWNLWFFEILHSYAPALAIILGMGLIAGEVSGNTMSFLLTRPFSRAKFFTNKYLTGAGLLLILTELTTTYIL